MIKKLSLLVSAFSLVSLANAKSQNLYSKGSCFQNLDGLSVEVGGQPESVFIYKDKILASNIGEGPLTQENDGYISLLNKKGELIEKKWLPKEGQQLDSPLGMAVQNDILYVADLNKVAAFDLKTEEQLPSIDFTDLGATFLNDIVAADAPYIYVSATNIKKVFRVNVESQVIEEIAVDNPDILVPNGLAWSKKDKVLYIAQNKAHTLPTDGQPNGSVVTLDSLDSHKVIAKSDFFGQFIDGIALTWKGYVVISDWKNGTGNGDLFTLNQNLEVKKQCAFPSNGFADFSVGYFDRFIVSPDLLSGTIVFSKLGCDSTM